jgi:RNA polymerase sigma-70 factor
MSAEWPSTFSGVPIPSSTVAWNSVGWFSCGRDVRMPSDSKTPCPGDPPDVDREEFARLFSRNARRLYGFIMTLVFSHHDAEEVFQNASVVLWNKFGEFQPGSNFFAWASKVAYYEVLSFMKQRRRSRVLSDESLELLANAAIALSDESSSRQDALDVCLSRLNASDRELLQARYYHQRPPKQIAVMQSRSVDSIYRALSRIHNLLLNCVERTLAREELT